MMNLQDLPLDILLEIAKIHPWVGCELAKTVRGVGLYSLEHDAKRWFKVEKNNETFILVKYSKEPYLKKLRHSWDDDPAKIDPDGTQKWYKEGKYHRGNDKPAVIFFYGTQFWYKEGKSHRDNDAPAIIYSYGTQEWHKEGKLHRNDDAPAIIYYDGTQQWFKEGKCHRDDKPAVISLNGNQQWFKEGKRYFPKEIDRRRV